MWLEQAIQRCNGATADKRERAAQIAVQLIQYVQQFGVRNDFVWIVLEVQKGSVDVEQQGRTAKIEERREFQAERSRSCLAIMMRCISLVPSPMHMSGASR